MPIGTAYQAAGLDDIVAGWPASGARYALFDGDPVTLDPTTGLPVGAELTGGGYTSPAFAPGDWAAATGTPATKTVSSPISFGTSTDAYAEVGTHWGIIDASDDIVYWDDLDSDQVVEVSAAGIGVEIEPSLFFEDA